MSISSDIGHGAFSAPASGQYLRLGGGIRVPRVRLDAPTWVSFALAALILIEAGRIGIALFATPHTAPAPRISTAGPHGAEAARVDVGKIVSAHLFGVFSADAASEDPGTAPKSRANLVLTGTIATQNAQKGMAIIGDGAQFKVYAVGQDVGDATLKWVYADHVVLSRNGALESLALPRPALPPGLQINARSAATPGSSGESVRPGAAGNPVDTKVLDKIAETDIYTTGGGDFIGMRVFVGEDREAFIRSGLIEGDVVVAINGTQLTDGMRGEELWKQVSTGTRLTVIRRGENKDVTVNLAP